MNLAFFSENDLGQSCLVSGQQGHLVGLGRCRSPSFNVYFAVDMLQVLLTLCAG
jgi:hypothetical protein